MRSLFGRTEGYSIHFPNVTRVSSPEIVALIVFLRLFPYCINIKDWLCSRFDEPQYSLMLVGEFLGEGVSTPISPK